MQVWNPHLISTYHSFPIFKENVQYLVFTSVVDAAESFPPESVIGDPSPRCWIFCHCPVIVVVDYGEMRRNMGRHFIATRTIHHIQHLMCGKQH